MKKATRKLTLNRETLSELTLKGARAGAWTILVIDQDNVAHPWSEGTWCPWLTDAWSCARSCGVA